MALVTVFETNIFWLSFFGGCLLFCWQLPHRRHFLVKFLLGTAAQLGFAMLWPEVLGRFSDPGIVLVCGRYLIHFLLLIGMVYLCYECDLIGAAFCTMCGYCLQHIANRTNVIFWTFAGSGRSWLRRLSFLAILLAVYAVGYRLFKRRTGGVVNVIRIDASGQVVISVVALFAMNIVEMAQFLYQVPSEHLMTQVSGPIQAVIFSCVVLMLEYSLLSYKNTETERNALKAIVQEKRSQVEFEKRMIETVNLNAHDLKHKVSGGGLLPDAQEDIIHAVDEFDTTLYTGNESLDVILSKKKRHCFQRDIQFICIADGKRLSFMGESDIFALMGNILDNAIEAVERLDDPDKRMIHLSITGKNCFVRIRAENYFQDTLNYSGKTLLTTKADKEHHGYGLKSISLLVEKYAGTIKIYTEEEMFILDILFPTPDDGAGGL